LLDGVLDMPENVNIGLLLTSIVGLSTGIGNAIAYLFKKLSVPSFMPREIEKRPSFIPFYPLSPNQLGRYRFLMLMPFLSEQLPASILAFVAGIISLDELLPTAHRYGHVHTVILGIGLGMFTMGLGPLMF